MPPTRLWALAAAVALAGCGGGGAAPSAPTIAIVRPSTTAAARSSATTPSVRPKPPRKPPPPAYPQLLPAATANGTTGFVPAVSWQGRTAAWVARTGSGIALISFDQRLLELRLHAGSEDPGGSAWRFGASVGGAELGRLVAAFNGGFKLSTGSGGYESYNRVAAPLRRGLGSIVTYSDGTTDIGTWGSEVPSGGGDVVSVRQNLQPLIDNGRPASNLDCLECWGATLGGVPDPARGALGVTADGRLIWAAAEHITASDLANALLEAHVVRAVELDINPEWVAGYLYGHRGGHGPLAPVPVLGAQQGIPGQFLAPWSRDFFAVDAR
jgi:hypothetical protein